ncbi:hypothetical protein GE09DRAFT_1122789, partial [Coniochaeta sp. 2T2.1]
MVGWVTLSCFLLGGGQIPLLGVRCHCFFLVGTVGGILYDNATGYFYVVICDFHQ